MSITKFFALATVAAATTCAFGDDASKIVVTFETHNDCYADGTSVKDGEWYALCWSADGQFGGLKLDGTPVREGDLVCLMVPRASNGGCPYTAFKISSDSPNAKRTGKYCVLMLDTRGVNGLPSAMGADKKPVVLNGSYMAKTYTAGGATSGTAEDAPVVGTLWAESDVTGVKNPIITGFKVISDAYVQIEVEDLVPAVRYNVKMGADPQNFTEYGLTTPTVGVEKATFIVEPEDAKFFKVTREPLVK